MTTAPHQLLLASAGTGKTYQLTNHFLRLLFAGVEPERILATTFTRKAAGEILDRVLERLAAGAEGEAGLADLRAALAAPDLTAADCRELLGRLSRGLDRFQVRTIDSFFVLLARLFALDLELPPDWGIIDEREDRELREEALQELLGQASRTERLELLRGLQKDAAARRVHDALLELVAGGRTAFLESRAGAWDVIQPEASLSAEALAHARAAWMTLELPVTKKGTPNANWKKAHAALLEALDAERWEAVLEKGLGAKYLAGDLAYSRVPFEEEHLAALAPLVRHACAGYVALLARQNAAMRTLLGGFEETYRALARERGAYTFGDLSNALAPRAGESDPFEERELDMWFRLDGRVDHLLLDEFQDTAPVQWRILRRLADEILADGTGERSCFCVGDVKQSIYGWRQAEPRLLQGLGARYPVLEAQTLTASYRSSAVVLETVNELFAGVAENALFAGAERAPLRRAAEDFARGYELHTAAKQLPGAARIVQCEATLEGESASDSRPVVAMTVARARQLLAEAPGAELGVLLRKRKWIPALIHELREAGITASGEGGNPLTDSEAVLVLLSLCWLADHPDDTAAALHVSTSSFGALVGLAPEAVDEERRRSARELRARILHEGYGSFVGGYYEHVATGAWTQWDRQRYAQLIELAHTFDERASTRPRDFVLYVREESVVAPSAARVRVMTIHASKGLEFDAVLLPDLCEPMTGRGGSLLSRRPDPFEAIEELSVAPRKELLAVHDGLRELYEYRVQRDAGEALCVLYVAMTRAARCLELILRPHKENQDGTLSLSFQNLVHCAFRYEGREEAGLLWEHAGSSADWGAGLADAPADGPPEEGAGESTEEPSAAPPFHLAPSTRPRKVARRAPSAAEGGPRVHASELLRSRRAASRGTLVHLWLEGLVWLEDWAPDEEALLAAATSHEPDAERRAEALAFVRGALAEPGLRAALSRAAFPAELDTEVLAEHEFRLFLPGAEGEEELWSGAIDRLVLLRESGAVVGAEVLDYKTDEPPPEGLASLTEYYRPQLEAYRRVVAVQYGLTEERIATRLAFLAAGEVVEL